MFPVVRYGDGEGQKVLCGWSILKHRSFRPENVDLNAPSFEGVVYEGGVKILQEIDLDEPMTIVVGERATGKEI